MINNQSPRIESVGIDLFTGCNVPCDPLPVRLNLGLKFAVVEHRCGVKQGDYRRWLYRMLILSSELIR